MVQTRTRVLPSRTAAALDLPPVFRLVTLREAGNAFAHAKSIAAKEGAGTLVWVRRFDLVEFALVIEPDEPLRDGPAHDLCGDGGACRCARRARAAGAFDRVRLAGHDLRRGRGGGRRRAWLAQGRRRRQAAATGSCSAP